jgi:hypothetical protein
LFHMANVISILHILGSVAGLKYTRAFDQSATLWLYTETAEFTWSNNATLLYSLLNRSLLALNYNMCRGILGASIITLCQREPFLEEQTPPQPNTEVFTMKQYEITRFCCGVNESLFKKNLS